MKKRYPFIISMSLLIIITSCKKHTKENQTKFAYEVSVTAPKEYPVEVYYGYLSANEKFITTIPKDGVERQGWNAQGSNSGSGGSIIPDFLELTWLSYAEKKFWKLEASLPTDKILALFRKGFTFKDSKNDSIINETFDRIIIGTAPGGVVVVWLDDGSVKRVEIGRYQAKEVYIDKMKFQPVKDPDETQEEFLDYFYKAYTPEEIRQSIEKKWNSFGFMG